MKFTNLINSEYDYYDGENFINFIILNSRENSLELAIVVSGRISVKDLDIFEDSNGFYFEYRNIYEKIYLKNFSFMGEL